MGVCLVPIFRWTETAMRVVRNVVTSTTLAEMQCSVSSVGVQTKGSFIVFVVIKMSLFPHCKK